MFSGKTVNLVNGGDLQIIFGPDDILYWVDFTMDDRENQKPFSKMVRMGEIHQIVACCFYNVVDAISFTYYVSVQRNGDKIIMRDDLNEYHLNLTSGTM